MDKVQYNIEKIREMFPNAVTEVNRGEKTELAVDFDVLKQELADTLIDERELRYQFTWPDKQKSILLANTPVTATLRPDKEKSVDFDNTQNLYIEGDNLDVLKLLRETYLGKIKMIYIDPPYNTGNDFVYEDDFSQSVGEYAERNGEYDEAGNRLFQNTESNGRFHTDWLNMIYPRLKVAKDLLSDDGVIFISIDDNELYNLKKICDEVFGIDNFIANISWRRQDGQTNIGIFARVKEYILIYGKSNTAKIGRMPLSDKAKKDYQYKDEKGYYGRGRLREPVRGRYMYDLISPTGKIVHGPWLIPENEFRELEKQNLIHWPEKEDGSPRRKIYLSEMLSKGQIPHDFWGIEFGTNQRASIEVEELFGKRFFDFPKPVSLLKNIILLGASKDSIILDFFSGSATTAHAVMQLNAEDGGNRKFIMVQLSEPCDEKSEAHKAGYKTICDIGEERIRRAGKKIMKELGNREQELGKGGQLSLDSLTPNPSPLTTNSLPLTPTLDIGFRVLRLDSSNMREVYYHPEQYTQTLLDDLTDNIKKDRTPLDLLFQVMLDLGVKPSAKIEEKEIAGKHVFVVNENELIACFDNEITDKVVKAIAKCKPLYAAFRDSSYASDSVAANFAQIFATYSPNTKKKVL